MRNTDFSPDLSLIPPGSRVLAAVNMMGRQLSQLFSTTEDDGPRRLE